MSEIMFYNDLLIGFLLTGAVIFPLLFFIDAPYGRYIGQPWQGSMTDNRLGWILMGAPAALVFALCFIVGDYYHTLSAWIFLGLWVTHYVHRAFIFPRSLRGQNKHMPILTPAMACCFNLVNGYLNGRCLFTFSGGYPNGWLVDLSFIIGAGLCTAGYVLNRHADHALRTLRAPNKSRYKIPHSGLFRWISSPNYLGELIEWIGWAIATWSVPGLVFALGTLANLIPRARANHRWYRARFSDYPPDRKALLPGL